MASNLSAAEAVSLLKIIEAAKLIIFVVDGQKLGCDRGIQEVAVSKSATMTRRCHFDQVHRP